MKRKKTGMLLAATLILLLSACGGNNGNKADNGVSSSPAASGSGDATPASASASAAAEELKPVKLSWYFPLSTVPADLDEVEEALNVILKEKINATVDLKAQPLGDYESKMNVVAASGEKTDIIWTSNWSFNYIKNARAGAFLPLNDLLAKYAPEAVAALPEFVLDATRIDGEVYGVPNYQTVTNREGFAIAKKYADKYGLDPSAIKSFKDIEPFLERVKAGEPDNVIPFIRSRGSATPKASLGIETINGAYVRLDEEKLTARPWIGSEESRSYVNLMHDWYEKGYINEDAPTVKTDEEVIKAAGGNVAVMFHTVMASNAESAYKSKFGEDVVIVPITDFNVNTGSIITTMNAISRTSENPERAAMFLNLINSDKEVYNILNYGIEGKHYTKLSDNEIEPIPDSGYKHDTGWVLGNTFLAYLTPDMDPALVEQVKKDNENATPSRMMGFTFDPDPVTTETAAMSSVSNEYSAILNTGAADPAKLYDEYTAKVQQAGVDKIVAEVQRQLDAFEATKK